ncbi:hypothetical protein AZZ87_004981 [Escherichia coli]|nr:hypothetical protein AZZ87_004981 [Escherichia coli]
MFEDLVKEENGKDSLTQLLNRRFIPTIMRREISIALHSRKPFALVLITSSKLMIVMGIIPGIIR